MFPVERVAGDLILVADGVTVEGFWSFACMTSALTRRGDALHGLGRPTWTPREVTLPGLCPGGIGEHRALPDDVQSLPTPLERKRASSLRLHIPTASQSPVDNDWGDKPCRKQLPGTFGPSKTPSYLLHCIDNLLCFCRNSFRIPNNLSRERR